MRTTLTSYLDDFCSRGDDIAYARRRALRTARWSYGQTARAAFRFSRELESRGISRGDRVLIMAANGPEWAASFFGCMLRGAVAVPLDLGSERSFVSRVQDQVEAKLAAIDGAAAGAIPAGLPAIGLENLEALLARHSAEPVPPAALDGDDVVEIVFTSGTTAEPKGVIITHRNLLANIAPLEEEIGRYRKWERFVHPLRFLNLLPLSHIFGQLMGIFVPQLLGGEVFFQDSLRPSDTIETIRRERISVLIAVPRMLDGLRERIERDHAARGDLERFRRALAHARERHALRRWWTFRGIHSIFGWKFWAFISGGAALPMDTEEFWDALGFAVIQGYGMTETASLVSVNHPFRPRRGSIGRVMAGQEVRLAENGEILVRGRNVSPGYWRRADAAEGEGGWLHTGDLGEMDADGNLYFKGRTKETIVTASGMKIHPEDLERVLNGQPEIREGAVVAIEGPTGPEPLAVLILRRPAADAAAAIERANRDLAEHQRLRRWCLWPDEDFPRTLTQKVRKRLVAERAKEILAGRAGAEADRGAAASGAGAVDAVVARIGGGARGGSGLSATLGNDLKLDSLGRIELLGAVEDRYQVEIDEAALTEETTIGDVARLVRERAEAGTPPYPYPRWQMRAPLRWLRIGLLYALVLPFARALGRPRIVGAERLRDLGGPVLFVCNHVTVVDHALVLLAVPGRFKRTMAIAMDGEVLRDLRRPPAGTGFWRRALRRLEYGSVVLVFNVFSMPRKSGFRRSFAFAGEMIDRGASVLVFPEGKYTTTGGMDRFMPGTGLLVAGLGVHVVPMRIDGLWELKRSGAHHAPHGGIAIRIGEPVRYEAREAPERIADDLWRRVRSLPGD